ncbi:MAG: site-2 protease family protein [Clostridia bacterium]|nr:site-2 protease family protein [Clostridia bacterium]
MFSYITSFLENPREMLIFLLLSIPGRFMALSLHEFAHAWMANRCGDPTARMLGRLTVNPARHLDPVGTVMMLLLGFGWAKPVPVNPRNYRNYRWDDLKVSIAGVTMNLLMFVLSFLLMCGFVGFTIHGLPHFDSASIGSSGMFTANLMGQRVVCTGEYYFNAKDLFTMAPYVADYLIEPALGRMAGYIYQMLSYFVLVNIALAVFNLIPVPPLDGYHVLNDLLLKRSPFASPRASRIAYGVLLVLIFCTPVISKLILFVENLLMTGLGSGMYALFCAAGIL